MGLISRKHGGESLYGIREELINLEKALCKLTFFFLLLLLLLSPHNQGEWQFASNGSPIENDQYNRGTFSKLVFYLDDIIEP